MKTTLYFPSYAEFIQRSESLKCRQERLIQVRQNEKKKAAQFLDRMRTRAQEEYENTERYIMNEICELHSKELASMRQVYEECIAKINQEHYNKVVRDVQNRTSNRTLADKNVLRRKSPVKTIVICEDSQKASVLNSKNSQVRLHENIDRTEQKRNLSPTKRTIRNKNQDKIEIRTTSIYHEKCVPSSQRSSPKKKSVPEKSIQTTPTITVNEDQLTKKMVSVKSIQTAPNLIIVDEDRINKVTNPSLNTFLKKSTEDFLNSYTQLVHDRIRILEQKERMLQRRAVLLPEYDRLTIIPSARDRVTEPDVGVTTDEVVPTASKKFLTAETDAEVNEEKVESSEILVTAQSSKSVATNTEANIELTPKKTCNTAIQTSRLCKKKKNRRCKRANLAKNEDMIIFIRNQNEFSNVVENEIPPKVSEKVSLNTSGENESLASETERISLSVQNFTENIAKPSEKCSRNRKLDNWRRLFINSEKLSESSYYSPPDPSGVGQKLVMNKKKKCKRKLMQKNTVDECNKDIGYYVAKLLLMSPESVENLNTVSEEIVTSSSIDEIADEKPESVRSDIDNSMDEEEFLRRMLEIKIPEPQTDNKRTPPRETSPPRTPISLDSSTTIVETDVKSMTSSMTLSENSKTSSKDSCSELKDASTTNLKLDSKLSGWVEASIRRTLEASAVNSTSSYDECDNLRQVDQLVLSLMEKYEYFLSSEKSSSPNTRFSFSPVAVPDIRLNVPRLSGTST